MLLGLKIFLKFNNWFGNKLVLVYYCVIVIEGLSWVGIYGRYEEVLFEDDS